MSAEAPVGSGLSADLTEAGASVETAAAAVLGCSLIPFLVLSDDLLAKELSLLIMEGTSTNTTKYRWLT